MTKTITPGIIYFVLWANSYFVLFSTTNAHLCTGNGLMGCACNFIGACVWDASMKKFSNFQGTQSDLDKYLPSNLRQLAKVQTNVANICEPGSIGIIYDCENRIPIASTIVMTADQYNYGYSRPSVSFENSAQIDKQFQQNDNDYFQALERIPCYVTPDKIGNGLTSYVERNWYYALTGVLVAPRSVPCPTVWTQKKSPIHRGHLIAARYGRGKVERIRETFVYTNSVPQFGRLNSGTWNQFEGRLIKWASDNCKDAPLHIIVGTIPSTYGLNEKRFVGKDGFSDFFNVVYRVNTPAFMWTAACCNLPSFTKSTAFYSKNQPGRRLVQNILLGTLFLRLNNADLFPSMPSCQDAKNFVKI